ncbi:hypothetical protein BASA50_009669 [Batrachochytrium salamandrivorans]|uniref:Uncharacterized protein n=1 Tax=Batrachochytrium salamandrivorans TaxID=1357716 RepID=A0ABQ8F0J1_9FUNG|nr:hypothetical protein BASA60_009031 [Batrachochytrium salamandrivorans]KAH6581925.1 hypothetical protein BASA61_008813 [Batrachochytrium salamandrivorans]KAH6589967.1 hypothetical protein BASA50_009669 [Batrachochytrium salamandrivorans]KAH9270251.1 hypothetical protein BASA83_007589 [Batrachochytrium salamandrivorans]KAJ1336467.1 hypothetical protein BSLG_007251 [Batrachochytrium salamandrivorans]
MQDIPQVIKADWHHRDFVRTISRSILEVTEFLRKFEMHARQKIGALDERLERMERSLATYEARALSLEPASSPGIVEPSQIET